MALRIEWMSDLSDIADLQDLWVPLEKSVQNRSVYSRYHYAKAWYDCYAGSHLVDYGQPLVGLAWKGEVLVGIAPLLSANASFAKIPVLRAVCAGYNHSAGELLVADYASGVEGSFLESLRNELGYDLILLRAALCTSPLYTSLQAYGKGSGIRTKILDSEWYAIADLNEGYRAYARNHGCNFRKQTRKIRRKVTAAGRVRVDRVKSFEDEPYARNMLKRMLDLAEKSWRVKQSGLAIERQHQPFHRDLFNYFGQQGEIDLAILVLDEQDVAFSLGLTERGNYYHSMIGFDEKFSSLSPGTYVTQEVFRSLPDSGCHTVISHGSYEYKRRWASAIVPQRTVFVFGTSLRATLAYWLGFKLLRWRGSHSR